MALLELDTYTGQLNYKDILFTFVFDGSELRLIPPADKSSEIEFNWILTPIGEGTYTSASPQMESPFLTGQCSETGRTIIFITEKGANIGSYNSVLTVPVLAYIDCRHNSDLIDRITFSCSEIDKVYPLHQSYMIYIDPNHFSEDGVFTFTTKDLNTTTTPKQQFYLDNHLVYVQFCISRGFHPGIDSVPISLSSVMSFTFEPTNDYIFIYQLCFFAKRFLQFLCYRKDVYLPKATLSTPFGNGQHESFATLYILQDQNKSSSSPLKNNQLIQISYLSGSEGKILTDICNNTLYLRHLPSSYENGRHIDEARFVMITAAFEWEFKHAYPDGLPKKESTLRAESEVESAIQSLINQSTGKVKHKYQFLKKLIRADSLQNEIIQIGKDFDDLIGTFGRHLYNQNGQELHYEEMGKRLADQRNHFAHGDLSKEFIGLSLLDLIYLEYIIYALQLKHYTIPDDKIRKSINDLFHLNFAL